MATRRRPEAKDAAVRSTGQENGSNGRDNGKAKDQGPKVVTGQLVADPSLPKRAGSGYVGKFVVDEIKRDGTHGARWNVDAWGDLAEDVANNLRQGDTVKVMARHKLARDWETPEGDTVTLNHDLTARDLAVKVGDDFVALGDFDRDMLTQRPEVAVVQDVGSLADGGMGVGD